MSDFEKNFIHEFENRKGDHMRIALSSFAQASGLTGLDRIRLVHEALPEINFSEVSIATKCFSHTLQSPIFISSMTAGHENGKNLNQLLAKSCEQKGWMMGVGSQRRELGDAAAAGEWKELRKAAPKAILLGNIGIAQVIGAEVSQIQKLVDGLEAKALFVHLNSLQEVLQPEGTHNFKGGLRALENLVKKLSVPVVVKEVGCGFSAETLKRLELIGVAAVDVAGLGGTHWGRVEGLRSQPQTLLSQASETFANWGISTIESMQNAKRSLVRAEAWASGGVRSGLDAAKLIALGAKMVGVAQPALVAALNGEEALVNWMQRMEFELKVSLFCTGSQDINEFASKEGIVSWN